MPLNQIQPFQPPNIMNKALQIMQLKGLVEEQAQAPALLKAKQNAALAALQTAQLGQDKFGLEQKKFGQQKTEFSAKQKLERFEFGLGLLDGVDSQEKLDQADAIFNRRFPDNAGLVKQLIPEFTPQGVDLVKNAGRKETERIRREELGLKREELEFKKGKPETTTISGTDAAGNKTTIVVDKKTLKEMARRVDKGIAKPQSGIKFTTAPDGTITFETGVSKGGAAASQKVKDETELTATQTAAADLFRRVDELKILIGSEANTIGAFGKAQRIGEGFVSQVSAIAKAAGGASILNGKKVSDLTLVNSLIKKAGSLPFFKENAIKSAKVQASMIRLAYSVARMAEPQARQFSDSDIKRALQQVGGKTGSTEQALAVLDQLKADTIAKFSTQFKAVRGSDPNLGELFPGQIPNTFNTVAPKAPLESFFD